MKQPLCVSTLPMLIGNIRQTTAKKAVKTRFHLIGEVAHQTYMLVDLSLIFDVWSHVGNTTLSTSKSKGWENNIYIHQ